MDVFVIPIDSDRYELYCEPHAEGVTESEAAAPHSNGKLAEFLERWRQRFAWLLSAAERGELLSDARSGWFGRLQSKMSGWMAERIAEQRLLWRLRGQEHVVAVHPLDMPFEQVKTLVRRILQRDYDRHRLWLIIDAVGMILSWPLVFVPGPILLLYYFMLRVGGHWFSMNGARQGLDSVSWSGRACPSLGALRGAAALDPISRERRVKDVAAELRLPHLSRFFERVAVRHA